MLFRVRSSFRSRCGHLRLVAAIGVALLAGAPSLDAQPGERYPEGVTPEIERALEAGIRFLVRTQNPNGSWNNMGGYGSYPVAMTSLAGTALLMTGSTATRGPHSSAVGKAADFLISSTRPDGYIVSGGELHGGMHGHGFALLFLAQVYGMEDSLYTQQRLHDVLTRGARLTERSQSRAGGWLYSPDSDGDEGSVTVTQIQGLRACRDAGIQVNHRVVKNAVRYIEMSMNPDGGIRYMLSGGGSSRPPISAAAVATLYNAGEYDSKVALRCLKYCDRTISPSGAAGSYGHHFYAHLYYAQAKYQVGGRPWIRYYRSMSRQLLAAQAADGSWNGDGVGTTYGTAIAVIILGLPYQAVPIYQR